MVIKLLMQAATDPHVLAIKMTIYRLAKNSEVIAALPRRRQRNRQVFTCFVEIIWSCRGRLSYLYLFNARIAAGTWKSNNKLLRHWRSWEERCICAMSRGKMDEGEMKEPLLTLATKTN